MVVPRLDDRRRARGLAWAELFQRMRREDVLGRARRPRAPLCQLKGSRGATDHHRRQETALSREGRAAPRVGPIDTEDGYTRVWQKKGGSLAVGPTLAPIRESFRLEV